MSTLARFVIHLYPAAWRRRYGDEFEALLEDRPPTLSNLFDLMKGAIKMHLAIPSFPKLALLLSVIGLVTGWGVSFLVTPTYVSETVLQLSQAPGSSPAYLRPEVIAMYEQVLSRTSLSTIITDPRLNLYRSERSRQPLEDVIQTMRTRDIRITPIGTGAAFTVRYYASDPVKAREVVRALITRFQDANLERQRAAAEAGQQRTSDQIGKMEARIAALEKRLGIPPTPSEPLDQLAPRPGGINLDVLDPPSFPINPAKPNRTIFAFFGFGAGFIAALIVVIFRRPAHPAISFPAQPA